MANDQKTGNRLLRVSRVSRKLLWTKIYVSTMILYSILMVGLSLGALLSLINFKTSDNYNIGQGKR
jgi:hypothetical protein